MPEKTFLINSQYGHSLSSDGSTFAMNLQPPLVLPNASSAAQVAQAVPQFDYTNLSTAQIKKLVPYGQVLHLLSPDQIDVLLGENQMNPLDGRAALISATTKRFSIPSTKKKFTITATGKKVFW